MTLELTRRDALAALAAGGVLGGGAALAVSDRTGQPPEGEDKDLTDGDVETLVALAEVLYPSAVSVTAGFVRGYVGGHDADRRAAVRDSLAHLDDLARRYTGSEFAALAADRREAVLRRAGVDAVPSSPEGRPPERIRYHLVNSLLYALYTSPRGSELLGIENPTGHPGGYESLMRDPEGASDGD